MSLGARNAVKGCPGWFYGLMIADAEGAVTFSVSNPEERVTIVGLRASAYRTTRLARFMGERKLNGWQHVAQDAIRSR